MYTCVEHETCIDDALQKADMICHDKGLRFTELRRKVLEIIWENHGASKAYDILDKLKGNHNSAKPPTVYRALDFLLENNLIHKLNSLNSYVGCSHPLTHNECYFLICGKCGEIKECCNNDLAKSIMGTSRKNNFNPKQITLEIEGECQECVKNN